MIEQSKKTMRYFPFHSARARGKMRLSHDEKICSTTSRPAAPAVAALVQGPDTIEAFQSADILSGTHLEGVVDKAHGTAAPPDFSEAPAPTGRHHVDWSCVVFD